MVSRQEARLTCLIQRQSMLPIHPWRPRLQSVLLGLGLFAAAQAGVLRPGTDLETHRFQPPVAPERMAPQALQALRSAATAGMSAFAAQQIADLQGEKAARTPAQAKIDSRHLFTARMLLNRPAAPGVPYLRTEVELDADNDLVVQLSAEVSGDLLARLAASGVRVVEAHARYHSILARVPAGQLEAIAEWPDIHFIGPRAQAVTAAAEGDLTHRAAQARSLYGVDGSGLKIGVLSNGVANLAASQALGALGPVEVLTVGGLSQAGIDDEGTAMLEILHGLAPGASLAFATAFTSVQGFADNIRALRAAGCDILVDDVSYLDETRFQDGQAADVISGTNAGIISQAVNEVVAGGALYFSSAANDGNLDSGTAGVYEGDFVDGGPAAAFNLGKDGGRVHQFAPGVGYDTFISGGSAVNLTWADPLGASSNDYDLYLLDSTGTTVVASSTNIQAGAVGSDPEELVGGGTAGERIVVVKYRGENRFFNLSSNRGTLTYSTPGATFGHNAASGAFTVAATPAVAPGPYPGAFTGADAVESFSSDGPRRIFFQADGSPITPGNFTHTGGTALQKPDFTAADGVSVTGVGGFGSRFYGTSAAAPHAAAIAALVKSAAPGASSAALAGALKAGAIDIMGPGWDRDSGAGILMADAAIQSLGAASVANLVVASAPAAENPGNGDGSLEAGEGGVLPVVLTNATQGPAAPAATAITATLTSPTPGVVVAQPATLAYADLAPGASASGPAPFRFTLGSGFDPTSSFAEFDLNLGFTGGAGPGKTVRLLVPVGQLSISQTLGSAPGSFPWVVAATGSQTSRISRDGNPSVCGTAKTWPGTVGDTLARPYDAYTFTARRSGCGEVLLAAQDSSLFLSIYDGGFVPASLVTHYLGDAGASAPNETLQASLVAGHSYTVVVNQVNSGAPAGSTYTLSLPGGLIRGGAINQAPVALARNLTLSAGADGTAAGSVDNGSSDPDGDPITLTQTPPGPYPGGVTPVLLTVTDPYGAIGQANATVTVTTPTTTVLTSTTGSYGTTQLTAAVTAVGATPAGSVLFSEGGVPLGSAAVDAAGHAVLGAGSLGVGVHLVVAQFTGGAGFLSSASAATALTVAPEPTTTTLTSAGLSPSSDTLTFTATVSCAVGTPSGQVNFLEAADLLASVALTGNTAVFASSTLAPGSHTVVAVFQGSQDFQTSSSAAVTIAPLATTTTLTSVLGSFGTTRLTATVSAAGSTPVGTVTFSEAGVILGTAPLDGSGQAALAAGGLDAGSHLLVASFSGNRAYLASASPATALQVAPVATATNLASSGPSVSGAAVTLTATVASAIGHPSGLVAFLDGGGPLGVPVALAGTTAVLVTSALSPGTHTLTAVYQGGVDFQGSTSAPLSQGVTLTLQVTPDVARLGLVAGQAGSFHLALSAVGALAGPVTFTCTGLPPGATASFSPASAAADNLPPEVTVTVTTARGSSLLAGSGPGRGPWPWLAMLSSLVAVPAAGRRRRRIGLMLGACAVLLVGLAACGGGGGGASTAVPVPQTRSYTLRITADSPGATPGSTSLELDLTS